MARWEKPDGFEVHEYGLLEVAQEFAAAGLVVVAGWRDWENLGSGGGIAPDLLVYLRYGPYGPGWHYLEYERSARSPSAAARKLGGYDSPLRGNDWPVLVVCRTDRAELNFQQSGMGMGIRMMTTTIPQVPPARGGRQPGLLVPVRRAGGHWMNGRHARNRTGKERNGGG